MPALSPTMTQGNVGAWKKAEGDELAPGDVLVEIETDKATMDFEFQEEGFLAKILVNEGTKDVAVGRAIGVYVEEAGDVAAFKDFTIEDAGDAGKAQAPPAEKEEAPEPKKEESSETKKQSESADSAPKPAAEKKSSGPTDRVLASPYAKTLALDKGIRLADVKGTGPNGRIIARDVEKFVPAAAPASKSASSPSAGASGSAAGSNTYTDTPISQMRKTIANRLRESKQINPDYIVSSTLSVSKLLQLRESLNAAADGEYRLSVNDLLVKAISIASKKVPAVNSAYLESEGVIREYENVDVSVAVATPNGLITPVVPGVNQLGLAAISSKTKDLAKRARDNKLKPEEYQGGTITISNMGMNHAVSMFTAIINPPQSAILAVGTVERRAIEDPESETGISFDDVMTVTASFDHKVVDGAVGAEWMKAFKKVIENPLQLML